MRNRKDGVGGDRRLPGAGARRLWQQLKGSSGGSTPSSGGQQRHAQAAVAATPTRLEGFTANSITIEGDVDKTSASGQSEALADLGAKARFDRGQQGGRRERPHDQVPRARRTTSSTRPRTSRRSRRSSSRTRRSPSCRWSARCWPRVARTWSTNKIPFFGWGITPAFCNNKVGFGYTGCLVPLTKDRRGVDGLRRSGGQAARYPGRHRQDRRPDLRGRRRRPVRHQGHRGRVRR